MNVVQEIAAWSKKLPLWQSDAIRRIFTQAELAPTDHEEILSMLLGSHGLQDGAPIPIPFSEVIEASSGEARRIILKELHSLSGVNALVAEQSLIFALDGLTVIYGENGAGKSGYARVFKHACHAREKGDPILSDVSINTKRPASAVIELTVDDNDIAVDWTAGSATSEYLLQIAVFDSQCARVFLDEANEVVYLPYGMDVFGRLASLCKALKERIRAHLALIPMVMDVAKQFGDSTVAGKLVRSLTDKSDPAHLEKLSHLNDIERRRLEELRNVVGTASANPPKQRAAIVRRTKARIEFIRLKVIAIDEALSAESVASLQTLIVAVKAAAQAAAVASTDAFRTDPLAGTGSDPWQLLFDAAKRFSEQVAYPDEVFPVVREGAVCLLCQQQLGTTAVERLNRFQQFVVQDATTKKANADAALEAGIKIIADTDIQFMDADTALLEELRAHDQTLADGLATYLRNAVLRKNGILKACSDGGWASLSAMPATTTAALAAAVETLEATALTFDQADDPDQLRSLRAELAELEDRERLAVNFEAVKAFIQAKKREAALRLCDRALDTTAITRFGSELMEQAVTEQLMDSLVRELQSFSVQCVPLKLRKSGDKGKTKHQLVIENGARPSRVLSEGEQRVVAIASFLAEIGMASGNCPIIFDDPVCSLDHVYRERVAKRLVKEAKQRQVVVFTHDIVMLLALENECADQGVPPLIHTVRRSANGPGECVSSPSRPWHACNTKERIGHLRQFTAGMKKLQTNSPPRYVERVATTYGLLREAWERAIEELLFNDTVQRFRPGIETQRLKQVVFEAADFATIDIAMAKSSTWLRGHDAAPSRSDSPPDPGAIQADIDELEAFTKALRDRQKKAGKEADATRRAPVAKVATQRAERILKTAAVA